MLDANEQHLVSLVFWVSSGVFPHQWYVPWILVALQLVHLRHCDDRLAILHHVPLDLITQMNQQNLYQRYLNRRKNDFLLDHGDPLTFPSHWNLVLSPLAVLQMQEPMPRYH